MVLLQKSMTFLAFLFFVPIIFIGSFFLLNLTLAVIKSQFSAEHKNKKGTVKKKKVRRKKRDSENSDPEEFPPKVLQ